MMFGAYIEIYLADPVERVYLQICIHEDTIDLAQLLLYFGADLILKIGLVFLLLI